MVNYKKIKRGLWALRRGYRPYTGRFLLIIGLGILAGIAGGLGIGAVVPLFSVLAGDTSAQANTVTTIIEKIFAVVGLPFSFGGLVILVSLLFIAKAVVQFLAKYVNHKTTAEYEARMRTHLFQRILAADWPFVLNQRIGYVERVIMNDVASSATIIIRITNLILLATGFLMYAVVAFQISTTITLLTAASGAVLLLALRPVFSRTRKISRTMNELEKAAVQRAGETMLSMKAIKAAAREHAVTKIIGRLFFDLQRTRTRTAFFQYAASSALEPLGLLFIAALFLFYYHAPGFSVVSFVAVIYLAQRMFSFIQAAQGQIHEMVEMLPYLESVLRFRNQVRKHKELSEGVVPFSFRDSLVLHNVHFTYENVEHPILKGVNMTVRPGESIGLVGSSGAGKTTIVDILLRLLQPTAGKITLDGTPIQDINLTQWRRQIAYVPQDMVLVNDSIAQNIRFYDSSITQEEIETAAKAAHIYDFIAELPDGFETVIGARGMKISVGQRQRIVLARALVRRPAILILDEATSSLDTASEALIQKTIEQLAGKVTVLAIAHRLSTILKADRILVLEEGHIVEEGKPEDLLRDTHSRFSKMYTVQA